MTKYPFQALAALMGCSEAGAARKLGISGKTEQEYRRNGMSEVVADRAAVKAGFHPAEVWPEWWDDMYAVNKKVTNAADSKRLRRVYLKDGKKAEAVRAARRRYYETCGEYERARQRLQYWADPEKERARRRERYARNREVEKARQAEYRARRKALDVAPLVQDAPMTDEAA